MCPVRQLSRSVNGLPCLFRSPPADHVVVVEREADRVNAAVAAGTHRVFTVLRKSLANRFWSRAIMIALKLWNVRWGRRWWSPEHRIQHPGTPEDRACSLRIRRDPQP